MTGAGRQQRGQRGNMALASSLPGVPLPGVPLPGVPLPHIPLPGVPLPRVPLPDVPLPGVPLLCAFSLPPQSSPLLS